MGNVQWPSVQRIGQNRLGMVAVRKRHAFIVGNPVIVHVRTMQDQVSRVR